MGRAGRRALSQDHEIRLITKGWEAVTMHDGKWGELQVEGIPGQRCRKGRNQEPGGPQSCRVRGSATGNEAKEASDEKKKICKALWSQRLLIFIPEEKENIHGATQQDCLPCISGAEWRTRQLWYMEGVV